MILKNQKIKKIYYWGLLIFFVSLLVCGAAYGVCRGWYEYIYYRDFKSVQEIKLLHTYPWERDRFEADLPVKFVSEKHDGGIIQRLPVAAENRKCFMIFRFEGDHVQLMRVPVSRHFIFGWYLAYYEITDKAAKEKLLKMLDARCDQEE